MKPSLPRPSWRLLLLTCPSWIRTGGWRLLCRAVLRCGRHKMKCVVRVRLKSESDSMCLGKVSLLAHILLIYLRVHICNHRYVSLLRSCQHAGYLSVTASLTRRCACLCCCCPQPDLCPQRHVCWWCRGGAAAAKCGRKGAPAALALHAVHGGTSSLQRCHYAADLLCAHTACELHISPLAATVLEFSCCTPPSDMPATFAHVSGGRSRCWSSAGAPSIIPDSFPCTRCPPITLS